MTATRAYHIVRVIANLGLDHAECLYGKDRCHQARFLLRQHIAQRQAKRARADGANAKYCARDTRKAGGIGDRETARHFEKLSRREYRKASQHDRTARLAFLMAQAVGDRSSLARPFADRFADRFAHMPIA